MIFTNIFQHTNPECKPLFYRFWSNCILIKGYRKSLLYDMFRHRSIVVSNFFCICHERYINIPVSHIANDDSFAERRGYLKMLDFFIKNDFGILVDDISTLPPFSMEYATPYLATNVIIETDSDHRPDCITPTIDLIVKEKIQALQINDYGHLTIEQLNQISEHLQRSSIEAVHIYTHFSIYYTAKQIFLILNNLRIRQVTFIGSPHNKKFDDETAVNGQVSFVTGSIDYSNCGNIGKQYFITNQPFFIEAHSCNTCLNRKVSIDIDGNIGNCPLMPHTFGNIKDVSLREVVSRPEFQRLWHITKDQIDVCKDCEYRYICTDCRHFIKDKKNIYSQPSKCGYNPYIAKWSDEEGYVPVEDCGTYSSETGFIPDRQRIEAINRQLERNEQLEK